MPQARLAQSAERKALNLVVVGSSPTVGASAALGKRARVAWSLVCTEKALPPLPGSVARRWLRPQHWTSACQGVQQGRITSDIELVHRAHKPA